jgi:predicted O-linked N-acetylglucosamine transferase (SPINDLY family)
MKKKTAAPAAMPAMTPVPSGGDALAQARQGTLSIIDLFGAAQLLTEAGQLGQAATLYRTWLEHTSSPVAYAAHFNLAVVLGSAKDDPAAEVHYRRAIALHPTFSEGYLNLGTLLERCGRPDEALDTWRSMLGFADPAAGGDSGFYVQALNNLGRLLEIRKRFGEAEEMLHRSLMHNPKQPNAITHWVHLRQKQCEWPVYQPFGAVSHADLMDATSALAMLSVADDPEVQLAAAARFVKEKVLPAQTPLANPKGYQHSRLRVGYLSSDFCSHAVSILTAELYALHDRSKVEVYGFCWSNEDGSPLRARVVGGMDHYVRIATMSDEEAARCIRDHEIDILFDLHGLTLGTRPNILSYRPAPVQITYLGFPGPTALPCIDYVISDPFLVPPELAEYFTEKPLHMPRCFQVNDRQRLIGNKPTKEACGLPEDKFVFCAFNNNFKFTEEVFAVWMRILKRVPDSILWLVSDHDVVRTNLRQAARENGVDPERLYFAARALPADYLARYQQADLFLDTFPFGAGTTASDALWAGLPLLTCAGRVFASRMAGSLLKAVDLPELITYSFEEYEEKAVEMANNRPRIEQMKKQLVENRMTCALFDTPQFVKDLEERLEKVAKGSRGEAFAATEHRPQPVAAPAPLPTAVAAPVSAPLASAAQFPLVSIVIPSYKPGKFENCLKSAIGQTYPNIEILVSDNCPTEEIHDICKKYLHNNVIYQRSSVIKTDNVVSALFSGKGKYIKPLFDDDLLHPFCVERMVSVMMMREDVEMVFSASQVINLDNQPTEARRPYEVNGALTGRDMQRSMALGFRNFVGELTSIMFKRQTLWNIGWKDVFQIGSHDFTRGLADVAFYCNLAKGGSSFYIDEELTYFRRDQRLMSNSNYESNPDFGYCFSDYIDLAIVSHETDVVSSDELVALKEQVAGVVASLGGIFHQVGTAAERYATYVAALEASQQALTRATA